MLGMLNYLQISIEYEEAIEEGLDNEMLYLILVQNKRQQTYLRSY